MWGQLRSVSLDTPMVDGAMVKACILYPLSFPPHTCHLNRAGVPSSEALPRAVLPTECIAVQVINFSMKPLSLHHRVHNMEPERLSGRPVNSLVLRGSFTMQVMHDWLAACLPDVPPR